MRLLELAFRIQKRFWRLARPRTRGVKVMLFNEAGELLLIRNSYGRSDLFVLPGGGMRPWERPDAAACREMKEELGCAIGELALRSTHFSAAEGKRDTIYVFEGRTAEPPTPDGVEVAEARFFALDALPPTASPATIRRIDEYRGARETGEIW